MILKQKAKAFFGSGLVKKLMALLVVAACCGFITAVVWSTRPAERATVRETDQRPGMPVSIRSIEPQAYPATVAVFGEVVPLWQTTIKAQVDGQISSISPLLQSGNMVKRGQLLVQIARSDFEMQVAEARTQLAAARLDLLREESEAWEAQRNWQQSGIAGEPDSPLVLREPQLAAAKSAVHAAQKALTHAETLLGFTEIRAPYDGIIMRRSVNPGESLFAGSEVATLYGMELAEVALQLDAAQWALLPDTLKAIRAELTDPQQRASWQAYAAREGRHLHRDSRLRTLFLQVKQPLQQSPPLLPGTFVQVKLTGKKIPGLLRIPEAALTKRGLVWFVDNANRLHSRHTEAVFYGDGVAYIRTPQNLDEPLRVAVAPNSSFVNGLKVQPIADQKGP